MSTLILKTKLFTPIRREDAILRPRLSDSLDAGLSNKLTLVSAPAGFGKTTLVCEWISRSKHPAAWLSLDERDNDLQRFLSYLIAALQTVKQEFGENLLAALQSPQVPPSETILTSLLNELTALPFKVIFVLDDYHSINSKPIDEALSFLIEHLPPNFHFVVITREDPDLPLARLRALRQLTEVRAAQLRFDLTETTGFFNEAMSISLTEQDIASLNSRTEGWVAGLQLAAISLHGEENTTEFIKSFTGSHHYVMDYLVEEVLKRQPVEIQRFLLASSILDRMCGSLCDAMLLDASGSSQGTLGIIENSNLFIIPLDNKRHWYRYHHLFAELLKQRLQNNSVSKFIDVPDVAELHIRASGWFESNGFYQEALQYAFGAKDFERAARILELIWPEMDYSFQAPSWLNWANKLPDSVVRRRPVVNASYAWALFDIGKLEEGETRLAEVEKQLAPYNIPDQLLDDPENQLIAVDREQLCSLPGTIAMARAYISQSLGDIQSTIANTKKALELLPEDDYLKRSASAGLLGCCYWSAGDLKKAAEQFHDSEIGLLKSGNLNLAMSVNIGMTDIRLTQGKLNVAMSECERSLKRASEHKNYKPVVTADMYLGLSIVYCEKGDLESADKSLQRSKTLGDKASLYDWKYRWTLAQANIMQAREEFSEALEALNKAEQLYFRTPLPLLRSVAALKARVWIKQNQLARASQWAEKNGLSTENKLTYLHEHDHLTFARLLIAKQQEDNSKVKLEELKTFLTRLLKEAIAGNRNGSAIEIMVLQSILYDQTKKLDDSLAVLEQALKIGEPEGYAQVFLAEGPSMIHLLKQAKSRGVFSDYCKNLLSLNESKCRQDSEKITQSETANLQLMEQLSERELEILQLIAQGLSNDDICKRLFLALSTVKGHNRNIFGKLQVQRRTEAVARARELGLLNSE